MIYSISSEGHRDRDEVWVIHLKSVAELAPLMEEPRTRIAEEEIQQTQVLRGPLPEESLKRIAFNPGLPVVFLISFSLDSDQFVVQGVDTTNVVNIYGPAFSLSTLESKPVANYPAIKKDQTGAQPLDIKLIQSHLAPAEENSGVAYAHFDPEMGMLSNGLENPVPILTNLLSSPSSFTEWLNSLADAQVKTIESISGEVRRIENPIRFQLPDNSRQLRILYQQNHATAPCYPLAPNGLCTKFTGRYLPQAGTEELVFLISEINLIPYCPPTPTA